MHTLLAITLLGFHPFDEVVSTTHCAILEVNTVFRWDDEQRYTVVLTQLIAWSYMPGTLCLDETPPASPYRVLAWRMVKHPGHVPSRHNGRWRCLWTEGAGVLNVTATKFLESWTLEDLEVADRRVLPMADRRGLGTMGSIARHSR